MTIYEHFLNSQFYKHEIEKRPLFGYFKRFTIDLEFQFIIDTKTKRYKFWCYMKKQILISRKIIVQVSE